MQAFLQQRECSHDIGLDKVSGAIDRTIDVALGCEIHHRARPVAFKQRAQAVLVADVEFGKRVTRMPRGLRNRGEVRRIGELVDIDDKHLGMVEQMPDDRRADEARPAGYEYNCAVVTHDRALMLLDSSANER